MTPDDAKTPVDQALDLLVYLPVGFLFELPRSIPRFIERGRRELHAEHLRLPPGGRFDAARRLEDLQSHTQGTLRALGVLAPSAPPLIVPTPADAASSRSAAGATAAPRSTAARTAAPAVSDAGSVGASTARASTTGFEYAPPADEQISLDLGTDDPATAAGPANAPEPAIDTDALAIPGYDSLSASQVVPRLAGLTGAELELVRLYEHRSRARKTILNKIAQIQAV